MASPNEKNIRVNPRIVNYMNPQRTILLGTRGMRIIYLRCEEHRRGVVVLPIICSGAQFNEEVSSQHVRFSCIGMRLM